MPKLTTYPEAHCPKCFTKNLFYIGIERYPTLTVHVYYCYDCDKNFEKEVRP